MQESEYRKHKALNQSSLKHILISPKAFKYIQSKPFEPSESMQMGTALHMMILEEKFDAVKKLPKFDRRTKAGKEDATQFDLEKSKDCVYLGEEMYDKVMTMHEAFLRNQKARELLSLAPKREVDFYKTLRGIECKGQIDACSETVGVDLKTTRDWRPEAFAESIIKYGYDFQMGFYSLLTGLERWWFICVSNDEDPDCVIYKVPQGLLDAGKRKVDQALIIYKACEESGLWPGPSGIQQLPENW